MTKIEGRPQVKNNDGTLYHAIKSNKVETTDTQIFIIYNLL